MGEPTEGGFTPRAGDILVQVLPVVGAQEGQGPPMSHCALAVDGHEVVEALWPRVRRTPLAEFLGRSLDAHGRPRVLVARVRPHLSHLAPAAVEAALRYEGRPYDERYERGDAALYCSELVLESFRRANAGEPVFEELAMTFVDPATGRVPDHWRDHFARLGLPVPEGEPGSNPMALAASPAVEVVHRYGDLGAPPG